MVALSIFGALFVLIILAAIFVRWYFFNTTEYNNAILFYKLLIIFSFTPTLIAYIWLIIDLLVNLFKVNDKILIAFGTIFLTSIMLIAAIIQFVLFLSIPTKKYLLNNYQNLIIWKKYFLIALLSVPIILVGSIELLIHGIKS